MVAFALTPAPPVLSVARIAELLVPYYPDPAPELLGQLSVYLDLLVKWNAKTNLTAIRDPETMVRRHFGESLFAARHLPRAETLLDLGSGAGFPGVPIQLVHPALRVTLAESQNKKAAFLREVVRSLGLPTVVWAQRSQALPADRRFDVVTLRAVDEPEAAMREARARLAAAGGAIYLLGGEAGPEAIRMPGTGESWLQVLR